ncbi:MAG: FAD synthetase family protein [Bacteroidetes bacterium]|nr:FAD synthetase family protein [Bacteroidota bacterium]
MNIINYNNTPQITEPSAITVGSFDGVHLGHQALLQQVKNYAHQNDCKSVLITFNPHPQEVLQMQSNFFLINSFEQKIILFERFGIDTVYVVPFSKTLSQTTATDFFEDYIFSKINVKAIFLGPNHHFGKQREGNADTLVQLCEERKIELIMTQEFKMNGLNVRSTLIRNYLAQNDRQNAEKLMGHDLYVANK